MITQIKGIRIILIFKSLLKLLVAPKNRLFFSGLNLIPFMQKEGEEVPDFSTIFYDKEKKRIFKRTEKKVETGGKSGMKITDKTLVHGTDADP